MHKVINNP